MKTFRDLEAWKAAMEIVDAVYKITATFPKEEIYGLTTQLRKASTSITANIAEGFGRFTYKDKANKYVIARGECNEVESFLLVAVQQKFMSSKECAKIIMLCNKTGRLLWV